METPRSAGSGWHTGLSARLLLLTVFFVMLSEVLIFAPSIFRFRMDFLQERVDAAHLASLSLRVPPDNMVNDWLRDELLRHAHSHGIAVHEEGMRALVLTRDMPPKVDATVDLRRVGVIDGMADSFATLFAPPGRFIRVVGMSQSDPRAVVETVIEEEPLCAAMLAYSGRILVLSVVISLITAALVYFSLRWLLVSPMRAITESMISFRDDPEGARRPTPSGRRDEIGIAQRELVAMQDRLRESLHQRARLAALGVAITKINHDLRNILATARLVSDTLAASVDPAVQRVAPRLVAAIDRAVTLCGHTVDFARDRPPAPQRMRFSLHPLVDEVADEVIVALGRDVAYDNRVAEDFVVEADREQVFRVLYNLMRNAYEAGARTVWVVAAEDADCDWIELADDGPGLTAEARGHLFQPFAGASRNGGTGLGLVIARDLARAHGGDLQLTRSDSGGTTFRLSLAHITQPARQSAATATA